MTKKFSYTFNYREELGSQQPSEIVVYREEHLLEPETPRDEVERRTTIRRQTPRGKFLHPEKPERIGGNINHPTKPPKKA